MTRAELEVSLAQQKTENAALRAQFAALSASPVVTPAYVPSSLLAFLLEEQHTPVVLADAEGYVRWVNKGFTALCGLELAEVVGRQPEVFLRLSLRDAAIVASIQRGLHQRGAFQYEMANPRPGSPAAGCASMCGR